MILLALTERIFSLDGPPRICLIVSMSRWNHLLTEIPSKTVVGKTPMDPPPLFEDEITDLSGLAEESVQIFSVSEINRAIKKELEGQFVNIWLQGEISNFKAHTSGHHYFALKDDKAQINGVMFKGFNGKLKFRPENGMEVLVRGKISVYEPRGTYQIFCEHMEPVGAGALQKAFEQLKEKLNKEGLFAQEHKKAIPHFPQKIGVVTSPTGAAIQDILNILGRRSKRVQVVVIPARVQGEGSADEIIRGIEMANRVKDFDVLIVGRGGGSIEDLWSFNEEKVARAIFASRIPIISAVGHEIDFTIADFVADMRAPTPSAAAELVAKSEQELNERLKFYSKALRISVSQGIAQRMRQVEYLTKGVIDPRKYLQDAILRLDDWSQRLYSSSLRFLDRRKMQVQLRTQTLVNPSVVLARLQQKNTSWLQMLNVLMKQKLSQSQNNFHNKIGLLESLSPLKVLDRGYAIVRSENKLIPGVESLHSENIEVEFRDGFIEAKVFKISKKEKP